MDAISSPTPNSYLDFDGLGQLKGQARTDAKSAIKQTAQQFEALFLQMMMKSMRESIVKSELSESSTMETFEGMFDKEVSVQLAKKNSLGLADMLVKNLEQQQANLATTADILKQRQDPAAFNATKGIPLHPKSIGFPLSATDQNHKGIALPKPQLLPLVLPPKPINGSGT
jgi:Rod binding domain-containing protein